MRLPAMALGLLTWTAGITVPAAYGAVIALAAAVSKQPTNSSFNPEDLMHSINQVPGVIWMYSLAMGFIGLLLVLSGLKRQQPADDDEFGV